MRTRLLIVLAVGLCLAAPGCDRGAHPAQVGRPAPSFTVQDGSHVVSLAQYRGKVVLLHFWASWCTYCLAEFPPLTELQRQMPGLVVLAVSFDEDAAAYREYVADNHIEVHTLLDTTQRSNLAFGTTRPPETFLIDRQGLIRRKFIGAQDWVSPEIVTYIKQL